MNNFPIWWSQIEPTFRNRVQYVDLKAIPLTAETHALKSKYESMFDVEEVRKRIPMINWQRAQICSEAMPNAVSIVDIGSGLGEFVNMIAASSKFSSVTSVDVKDYSLWNDFSGRVNRKYVNIFSLKPDFQSEVVTCFEVIEHLPPEKVNEAVNILRRAATRKLYISVPFKEPLPLYRGHFTRFDEEKITSLFPDAKLTIYGKSEKNNNILAWILCDITVY